MPIIGDVTLDTADLGRLGSTGLRRVAVHEMAHVLGFGTLAPWYVLLRDSAEDYLEDNPGATTLPDTHFVGSAAVSAFDELLDGATYDGNKVPVENDTAAVRRGRSGRTLAQDGVRQRTDDCLHFDQTPTRANRSAR